MDKTSDPLPGFLAPLLPARKRRALRKAFGQHRGLALLLAATTALTACAAGPDYHRPQTVASAARPFVGSVSPAVNAAAPADPQWWRLYNDPVLDGLIADALGANTDLRVAVAHLERARANLSGAKSDRLPQTQLRLVLICSVRCRAIRRRSAHLFLS